MTSRSDQPTRGGRSPCLQASGTCLAVRGLLREIAFRQMVHAMAGAAKRRAHKSGKQQEAKGRHGGGNSLLSAMIEAVCQRASVKGTLPGQAQHATLLWLACQGKFALPVDTRILCDRDHCTCVLPERFATV